MRPTKVNVGLAASDDAEPTACGIWEVSSEVAEAARRELSGSIEAALRSDPACRYVDRAEVVNDEVIIIVNHVPGRADQVCELVRAAVEEWLRRNGVSQPRRLDA